MTEAAALQTLILLKGAHVATAFYGNVALRDMGDLDLLVHRENLRAAFAIICALGYAPVAPFRFEMDMALGHHLTRCVKRGVGAVELHWTITTPGESYSIDTAELWERAVPVALEPRRATGAPNGARRSRRKRAARGLRGARLGG